MKKMFMAVIALMMTISASAQFYIYFSDGTVAKVDSISMVAPNPSLDDGDNNDATNTFFAGTPESRGFYTPSEAIAAVDAGMIYTGDSIKVGGIISRWYKKSSRFDSYRSVSFFVMDPVTGQEHEFEFYNCYSLGKDSFATYDFTDEVNAICIDEQGREFHVGDTVVGSGEYSYYEAYALHELKTNCYLTEWRPIEHKEAEPDTPTEPEEPTNPSAGIGVFSVSADKQVTFSKGNLQYTQSTNTWSFAENQWDMIGTDNVTGGSVSSDQYGDSKHGDALADKIDLFGWSASNTTAPFGVSTSKDYDDYYGSFVDWGTNQIGSDAPNTWRTLTYDEWYYLRYNRANANDLVGVAQVNGVNGLIFLPDTWVCPESVTFKSGFHSSGGVDYYAAYQTFTADQWSKLEAAGAVFLPAPGYRLGSDVGGVQDYGGYWSATGRNSHSANYLSFYSDVADMDGNNRLNWRSVRLVKDL
jgi:hypothetical protein